MRSFRKPTKPEKLERFPVVKNIFVGTSLKNLPASYCDRNLRSENQIDYQLVIFIATHWFSCQ